MKWKWQLTVVFLVSYIALASLFHFREYQQVASQNLEKNKTMVSLESQLLSKQVQLQFENIKTQFQQIGKAEHFERLNSSDSSMLAMSEDLIQGPFSGMVLLLKQSNWKPRWISLKPDLAQQWSQLFVNQLGENIPTARISENNITWKVLVDKQDRKYWLLLQSVKLPRAKLPEKDMQEHNAEMAILVGVLPLEALISMQSKIDLQEGSEAVVVNSYATAVALMKSSYLGTDLSANEFVQGINKFKQGEITQIKNKSSNTIGIIEKIPSNNLYLILQRVVAPIEKVNIVLLWQHVAIAILIAIPGLFFIVRSDGKMHQQLSFIKQKLTELSQQGEVLFSMTEARKIPDLVMEFENLQEKLNKLQNEKNQDSVPITTTSENTSSIIVPQNMPDSTTEMKKFLEGPVIELVLVLLGQIQIVRRYISQTETLKKLDEMEKHLRNLRKIIHEWLEGGTFSEEALGGFAVKIDGGAKSISPVLQSTEMEPSVLPAPAGEILAEELNESSIDLDLDQTLQKKITEVKALELDVPEYLDGEESDEWSMLGGVEKITNEKEMDLPDTANKHKDNDELDHLVSAAEIGQAPLFSKEELDEIRDQVKLAKLQKGKQKDE